MNSLISEAKVNKKAFHPLRGVTFFIIFRGRTIKREQDDNRDREEIPCQGEVSGG